MEAEISRTPTPANAPAAPAPRLALVSCGMALTTLRRRLFREANQAIDMLESALKALWQVDHAAAAEVRRRDDRVDAEEVEIERECLRVLHDSHPDGHDLRLVTFVLKVNMHLERVADHATSIAKMTLRLDPTRPPQWPTALTELGERVPRICHEVMRAVMSEDAERAVAFIDGDDVLDRLDKRVVDEIEEMVATRRADVKLALTLYRVSRELERVGDIMAEVGQELVHLATGQIIRHKHDLPAGK